MTHATSLTPPSLFNLHTGKITPQFQRQLDICDIPLREHVSGFGKDHILNVNRVLQDKCFQKDCDFYKKGNTSNKLSLSHEQAVDFLEDEYRDRVDILPKVKGPCDAIVGGGVEATMHKRFDAIKKALDSGCKFDAIHFIVKDESDKHMVEKMIKESYGDAIGSSKINFVVANTDLNILETGLTSLSKQGILADRYVLVTEVLFASKTEDVARHILKEKTCNGVAATSIKDWRVEMNLYGYEEALGSQEKAAIAYASQRLSFKAGQTHSELTVYQANKKESEKRTKAAIAFGGVVCLAILANFAFKKFQPTA